MSTMQTAKSPCSQRKSAPVLAVSMSAMTKIQQNTHHRPKSRVREQVPKVAMDEPLTAWSPQQSCLFFQSVQDRGTTLTSIPVLMRNQQPELASVVSRQLYSWLGSLITTSDCPECFPTSGKKIDTSLLHLQIYSGTSKGAWQWGHLQAWTVIFLQG